MAGLEKLFILSNKNRVLSTYKDNETLVLSTLDLDVITRLRNINARAVKEYGTYVTTHMSSVSVSQNVLKMNMTVGNQCFLDQMGHENVEEQHMDITFLDTKSNTDLMFVNQLSNLMNTRLFVIDSMVAPQQEMYEISYDYTKTLLTLQGFIIDCESMPIDYHSYLQSMFNL